jgi:hypothetical protein
MNTRLCLTFLSAAVFLVAGVPAPQPLQQVVYQHWPEQFVQWIGPELPYSMIELYVDPGKGDQPAYDVVLTERSSGKRVHYCNKQSLVDLSKSGGLDTYLANMQFDRPGEGSWERKYILRFRDHAGQPVTWQFVQGSDVTERGSGLSPAGLQPPVIMYREQSAVAGQGSAVKIGNAVSVAELWNELASPPFFMPYHGALTQDLQIAVFVEGTQKWTLLQSPDKLQNGAQWKFKAEDGRECSLTVSSVQGEAVTLTQEEQRSPGQKILIEAQFSNNAWSTRKVRFAPTQNGSSKGLTLAFNPALGATASQAKFELFSGQKTRIATGTVTVDQNRAAWHFKDPEWLRNKLARARNTYIPVPEPPRAE